MLGIWISSHHTTPQCTIQVDSICNVVFYGMLFMEKVSGAYQCKSCNHNGVLWLPSYWSKSKEPIKSLRYSDPLIWLPPSMSSLWVFYSWVGDEGGVMCKVLQAKKVPLSIVINNARSTAKSKDTFKPNSFLLVKLCDHLKPNVNSVWKMFSPSIKMLSCTNSYWIFAEHSL